MLLALSLLVVLVTSFFCSLSEASLLSVSRVRLHGMSNSKVAQIVLRMKDHIDRPIAAILILNTVANTGGAALAGREYQRTFEGANMALFTTGLTIAVLVFSELLPKTLGVRQANRAVFWVARPLHLLITLMRPLTFMVERATQLMGGARPEGSNFSLDDLRAMARLAAASKALGREEHMIIESAARLPLLTVSHIMIHREDIGCLSLADDDETNMVRARQSMHSRLLLTRDDIDGIVGLVSVKEVLWRLAEEPEDREEEGLKRILGESAREVLYVEPTLEVSQLLQLFSQEHEHMAVVKEGDHIVGIVTLEDVVEELIGEIDDEFDRSPQKTEKLSAGLWRFGGGTLWTEVAEKLQIKAENYLPEAVERDLDDRYDLHDLAADQLVGKLRTGAVFSLGRWRFKVMRMRRGKVLSVEVMMLGAPSGVVPSGSHPEPVATQDHA